MLAIHVMPTGRVTLRRMGKGKDDSWWWCVEKVVLDMGSDAERHGKAPPTPHLQHAIYLHAIRNHWPPHHCNCPWP
jgi:hypothetical protein